MISAKEGHHSGQTTKNAELESAFHRSNRKESPRKEGYEIRGANLTTDSEAASGVQQWKVPKIMLRNKNKGMNLDGRTVVILFEEVSTKKEVV